MKIVSAVEDSFENTCVNRLKSITGHKNASKMTSVDFFLYVALGIKYKFISFSHFAWE